MSTQLAPRTFSLSVRAHLCSHCGAATPVPLEGGTCACVRCGTTLAVAPRPAELPRHPVPVTEADRRARLAAQQDMPMIPPASIMPLFSGGGLDPHRRGEAEASWQALRRAVIAAPHDLSSADALSVLTIALVGLPDEDPARARARLETAREILTMPRHRDGLACSMARIAAREGELEDAESWLALVDPQSDVLEIDSGARFARSLIALSKGDFAAVLAALGEHVGHVPIHLSMQATCAVLRAHALERLGRVDAAVSSLRADLAEGRLDAMLVDQIRARFAKFSLIPQSWQLVSAARGQARAKGAALFWAPMAIAGCVFLLIGLGSLVPAVISIALSILPSGILGPLEPFVASHVSGGFGAIPGLIFGLGFSAGSLLWFGVAWASFKSGRDAAWLEQHGVPAKARLVAVNETGIRVNSQPMFDLQLRVELEGRPPYDAKLRQLVPFGQLAMLQPGAMLQVKVDPNDPRRVATA